MKTRLIHGQVWTLLAKSAKSCKSPAYVAVAYFGKEAFKLLPLPPASRLVVDASEHAVKSGQTCPEDLRAELSRGVLVYSVPNLHAKVYVLGRQAFIGSPNVSRSSAGKLIEILIATNEAKVVADARRFVKGLCLHRLTPEYLKKLSKLYRPPKGGATRIKRRLAGTNAVLPRIPRLKIIHLYREDWSDKEQEVYETGLVIAKRKLARKPNSELDNFRCSGSKGFNPNDVVIQITDEGNRRFLVSPPGNVIYIRRYRKTRGRGFFVYLELPKDKRRRNLHKVIGSLGAGARKKLKREGLVRDSAFARDLLAIWEQ
jgi:hypothetical protein